MKGINPNGLFPAVKRNSGKMLRNNYPATISAEEIALKELSWFRGEIVLIDNMAAFRKTFPRLIGSPFLGFDTETKPSFRKGRKNRVSLLQLANSELACLFRINRIGIPDPLTELLASPDVIKAGVAVHDDISFLKRINGFVPSGFIDLQKFVKEYGIQNSGLKKLAAIVLGIRISKRQQVSDWEADELTEAQIIYAATDAWICHQIYDRLTKKG